MLVDAGRIHLVLRETRLRPQVSLFQVGSPQVGSLQIGSP